MRFAVVFVVLDLLSKSAAAQEWKPPRLYEVAELVAAESLIFVDALQTLDMKRHPDLALFDSNPLMGAHPSDQRIVGVCALGGLSTAMLWYALPTRVRWVVPLFVSIGESVVIYRNTQVGMNIRF